MDVIEIRSQRRLYGVIVGGTALVFRHGREELALDLWATLDTGAPVLIERVCFPDGLPEEKADAHPVEQ